MPTFTQGYEEAARLAEEDKKERGDWLRVRQRTLKEDDRELFRPITECTRLITVGVHGFIPTKPKPADYTGKWASTMWGICRRDLIFQLRDEQGNPTGEFEEGYGDCYVCRTYSGVTGGKYEKDMGAAVKKTFGVVAFCEPVIADGKPVGIRDKVVSGRGADKKHYDKVPHLGLFSQLYSNFWGLAAACIYTHPPRFTDRFYSVERVGNDYTIGSIGQDPGCYDDEKCPEWERYRQALKIYGFDLQQYILDHASADHYARWFDPDRTPEGGYARKKDDADAGGNGHQEPSPASGPDVDPDVLAAFSAKLAARGASS